MLNRIHKTNRKFIAATIALTAALALAACEEQGPFEEAGEKIDDATEDIGNAVEDACEDAKDAANAEDKDC